LKQRLRNFGWLDCVLVIASVVIGFTLCRRGIILSDEGYLLLQSLGVADGKVLYRDLDAFVTPGVWFLLGALFKLVSPSVLASRLLVLVVYLVTLAVAARIVFRLADRAHARAAVGLLLLLTVWAFPAWTWSFYSPYALCLSLVALDRVLVWRASQRPRDLVWLGVVLGLCVIFKQNYGVLAIAGAGLGVMAVELEKGVAWAPLVRKSLTHGLRMASGIAAVGAPVVLYFVWNDAFGAAFQALVLHPFGAFLGQHDIAYLPLSEFFGRELMNGPGRMTYGSYAFNASIHDAPWPRGLFRSVEILHVLLYWIPVGVFAVGALLLLRGRRDKASLDAGLVAVLLMAAFIFLGVFPRADLNHLLHVYQPVVVAGAVVAFHVRRKPLVAARSFTLATQAAAALVLLGYGIVSAYWYYDLLTTHTAMLEQPRGGVQIQLEWKQMIDFEVEAIQSSTRPTEPVLAIPGLAMLNFLAERPMPGRYANYYAVHIAHDQGAGVVEALRKERVKLVVAEFNDFFSERVRLRDYAPRLVDHLRRYYTPIFNVGQDQHLFLRRRVRRRPAAARQSPLLDCDVGVDDWHYRARRDHLLFETLYHPMDTGRRGISPRRQASTLCRVSVPNQAHLSFSLGYRQPLEVAPGTSLTAEIWARPWGRPELPLERIFRETIEPVPVTSWVSPPAVERRVDLGSVAGADVMLLFRTLYEGKVIHRALDFRGFLQFWQDPQIESPQRATAR